MWCTNCRQDVPGIASQHDDLSSNGLLTCIRCGRVLAASDESRPPASPARNDALGVDEIAAAPDLLGLPAALDSWELEQRLKHVKRLVSSTEAAAGRDRASIAGLRIDPAQRAKGQGDQNARLAGERDSGPTLGDEWFAFFAWSALAGGLAAFTCGGVLTGWSIAAGRDDLWTIGLPTLIGGQLTLVLGLILQLQAAWRAKAPGAAPAETATKDRTPARSAEYASQDSFDRHTAARRASRR
ncbi:MAG TPA: hypothetical protein VHB99_08710 [Pirellulales bacterium]|nr:hypothetical protein [Pirellulales bacterium]